MKAHSKPSVLVQIACVCDPDGELIVQRDCAPIGAKRQARRKAAFHPCGASWLRKKDGDPLCWSQAHRRYQPLRPAICG